ncbi:hypothetical protein DYI22_00585 [Marinobacter lipolyticus]|uniref:hypothetical protein n=1 Tax=Marinobacter lipolyticus TaxID=209639 RepID=UPI001BD112FB|nr:hypothetical protein [Marinobacter lipolyticus]MBS8238997.1 hypothetical protein [Marinobacter lipolyticus]
MIDSEAQLAYGIFWVVYAVAFVVFFYMMSRLFRIVPLYGVRTLLQSALIVLLLTPVESAEVSGWWVPAWLYGGYELILGDVDTAGKAILNLGIAALAMTLVWVLDLVRYRLVER